jgi:hypothetical protein
VELQVNSFLISVLNEGDQLHVLTALSSNSIERHGRIFALCDDSLDPRTMDDLFKSLTIIIYSIKVSNNSLYKVIMCALFSYQYVHKMFLYLLELGNESVQETDSSAFIRIGCDLLTNKTTEGHCGLVSCLIVSHKYTAGDIF